jgi:hypothetical protein
MRKMAEKDRRGSGSACLLEMKLSESDKPEFTTSCPDLAPADLDHPPAAGQQGGAQVPGPAPQLPGRCFR